MIDKNISPIIWACPLFGQYLSCSSERNKKSGIKQMGQSKKKARERDDVAKVVAKIHRVEPRYVNMVREGDRNNEEILATVVDYEVGKNKLIRALEQMVQIKSNPGKYAREKN
jgi:hypothetical protein